MGKIVIRQLTSDFYAANSHLEELLDKTRDGKIKDKGRGYGVFLVDILGHRFALPLRSEMTHKENFSTVIKKNNKGKMVRKGLDFSKAVIITEDRFVSKRTFSIPDEEYLKIQRSEHIIIQSFNKYLSKYIDAVDKNDVHVLKKYNFSTLKNYHKELGLIKEEILSE